jgi:hypothetical protein
VPQEESMQVPWVDFVNIRDTRLLVRPITDFRVPQWDGTLWDPKTFKDWRERLRENNSTTVLLPTAGIVTEH